MDGRLENSTKLNKRVESTLKDLPPFVTRYFKDIYNKSHTTRNVYVNHVKNFLLFYSAEIGKDIKELSIDDLKLVSSDNIKDYMSYKSVLGTDGKLTTTSASALSVILSALNSFFNNLLRRGEVAINPTIGIERMRYREEKPIVYLTQREIKKIESNIENGVGSQRAIKRQDPWKNRDKLLFVLGVTRGIRITALTEINLKDIDLNEKTIKVTDKGNTTRYHKINDYIVEVLSDWLLDRQELLNGVEVDALFISNRKTRMSSRAAFNIVTKYSEGIEKNITPHKLRSTCGTNLYQKTKDIYITADVLGHKDPKTSQKYAAIDSKAKKEAVDIMTEMFK